MLQRGRVFLRRSWKRLRYGKPGTTIVFPFNTEQATGVLNGVLDRGTFAEINQVFEALGAHGYTGVPSLPESNTWQIVPISRPS